MRRYIIVTLLCGFISSKGNRIIDTVKLMDKCCIVEPNCNQVLINII